MPGVEIVAGVAAIVVALGIIWSKGVVPVYRAVLKLSAMYDTVLEIQTHTKELTPNGGSHMKDTVDRIERKLNNTEASLEGHIKWAGEQRDKVLQSEADIRREVLDLYKQVAARDVVQAASEVAAATDREDR